MSEMQLLIVGGMPVCLRTAFHPFACKRWRACMESAPFNPAAATRMTTSSTYGAHALRQIKAPRRSGRPIAQRCVSSHMADESDALVLWPSFETPGFAGLLRMRF
jgi:hypothetical protein